MPAISNSATIPEAMPIILLLGFFAVGFVIVSGILLSDPFVSPTVWYTGFRYGFLSSFSCFSSVFPGFVTGICSEGDSSDLPAFVTGICSDGDNTVAPCSCARRNSWRNSSIVEYRSDIRHSSPCIRTSSALPSPDGMSEPSVDGSATCAIPAATFNGDSGFLPVIA